MQTVISGRWMHWPGTTSPTAKVQLEHQLCETTLNAAEMLQWTDETGHVAGGLIPPPSLSEQFQFHHELRSVLGPFLNELLVPLAPCVHWPLILQHLTWSPQFQMPLKC